MQPLLDSETDWGILSVLLLVVSELASQVQHVVVHPQCIRNNERHCTNSIPEWHSQSLLQE
jgi:hypothetical protein